MDSDDRTVGRILTRREALELLGAAGLLLLSGCSSSRQADVAEGACVVRPEQTEGPFFIDELLNRSDIRVEPGDSSVVPGARLDLTIKMSRLSNGDCTPASGLYVDLWQCNAEGVYSGVGDAGETRFLRGYQVTGGDGIARFTTIYPGWYQGRTPHIHFKVRTALGERPALEFTSQLYFDDELTDRVFQEEPYSRRGARGTRNANDGIFNYDGGSRLLLNVTPGERGYTAGFDLALAGLEQADRSPLRTLRTLPGDA